MDALPALADALQKSVAPSGFAKAGKTKPELSGDAPAAAQR